MTAKQLAARIPVLPAVVPGQPILGVTVRTRYQSDAVTNETALLLEDVTPGFPVRWPHVHLGSGYVTPAFGDHSPHAS